MSEGPFLCQLVGSMSKGAAGNPTVAMIEAAFAHHGLHWRYVNMEVEPEELAAAVRGAKAMGFRGFNCSLPHKVNVIPHLDGLGDSAEIMGAVNCVVRRGDQLIGENTDGKGFLKSLQSVIDPRGKSIVLFGAGGAARAIAVELGIAGAGRITVAQAPSSRVTAGVGDCGAGRSSHHRPRARPARRATDAPIRGHGEGAGCSRRFTAEHRSTAARSRSTRP